MLKILPEVHENTQHDPKTPSIDVKAYESIENHDKISALA